MGKKQRSIWLQLLTNKFFFFLRLQSSIISFEEIPAWGSHVFFFFLEFLKVIVFMLVDHSFVQPLWRDPFGYYFTKEAVGIIAMVGNKAGRFFLFTFDFDFFSIHVNSKFVSRGKWISFKRFKFWFNQFLRFDKINFFLNLFVCLIN